MSSPSHFKGVVSLSPAAISPLPDAVGLGHHEDDDHCNEDVTLASTRPRPDVTEDMILPNIVAMDTPSTPSIRNKPQDAVAGDYPFQNQQDPLGSPSAVPTSIHNDLLPVSSVAATPVTTNVRSRKTARNKSGNAGTLKRKRRRHRKQAEDPLASVAESTMDNNKWRRLFCCRDRRCRRNLQSCMNFVARLLLWCTILASVALVVWYSYELKNNGKDPHLIAWFSAGAFVLLGFPISLYGIVMHLANYNQPETQSYIVRILWMVPIYSIESWLCLRYKDYAIYIETLRDCYESYVLYSFLQFLIQVLGGEEALILMLKDKSPTRGSHMWGLQWCVKPWLMGQPVRKTYMHETGEDNVTSPTAVEIVTPAIAAAETTGNGLSPPPPSMAANIGHGAGGATVATFGSNKPLKRVHWTSPFFVKCKFGVLQYVLLKFVCSMAILILERYDLYKEGNFTYKGGYLYICVLTNLSQCWALYCMIFFYYATKNELAPIRPVGKFLSVKALVFFTWWQSVGISILYQMDLIPHYQSSGFGVGSKDEFGVEKSEPDWSVPMSAEDATAFDHMGGSAFWSSQNGATAGSGVIDYTPEDVAKGMQDYLICIEMFVAAIVHTFVFPHNEYSPEAVEARARALNQRPNKYWNKRLGRKWKNWDDKSAWSGTTNTSRDSDIELLTLNKRNAMRQAAQPLVPDSSMIHRSRLDSLEEDDLMMHPMDSLEDSDAEQKPLLRDDPDGSGDGEEGSSSYTDDGDDSESYTDGDEEQGMRSDASLMRPVRKKNFVSALLDATIPQDLRDNTVGIIKGDYVVEKKTLLHHAATSDSYDLFSRFPRRKMKAKAGGYQKADVEK